MPEEPIEDAEPKPRYSATDLNYIRKMLSMDPEREAAEMMKVRSNYFNDRWIAQGRKTEPDDSKS